jgi:glycosyltransferase involved in cell wall biosynthesis
VRSKTILLSNGELGIDRIFPMTGEPGAKVIYLSYDGLTDPLGRSQILPYLIGLSKRGHQIAIISCEKPQRLARDGELIRRICDKAGLAWHPLAYHKRPPVLSSVFDAAALERAAAILHGKMRADIVHCRSYIPARAGLRLKEKFGVRFLFDMRGFWPDEKVEGDSWDLRNPIYALVYHYFKRLESRLLRGADHVVSLTHAGRENLLARAEIANGPASTSVIPCCVDFDHFQTQTHESRQSGRTLLGIAQDESVIGYLGSLGSCYMLGEMLDFFKVYSARHRRARFLIVTMDDPQAIRRAATERHIDFDSLRIVPASREEVPGLLAAADLGIFFIRPGFSKTASCPTKMGEMLAVGLPIVGNWGIGDVGRMIEEIGAGAAIRDFTSRAYGAAIDQIENLTTCTTVRRERALPWFDLELGIDRYDGIYRDLLPRQAS